LFGHCGQETLNNTVKMYGFKASGNFETYEQCAITKALQKNVNKNWLGSSNVLAESLYIDISSIKGRSFGGAKFWALIVDECTDYCWSLLMNNKSDLKAKIHTLLTNLKIDSLNERKIKCDNAGKNFTMKKNPVLKSLDAKFKFSGPRTPERNENVERKFQNFMEKSNKC
jgi:hypothetical protein